MASTLNTSSPGAGVKLGGGLLSIEHAAACRGTAKHRRVQDDVSKRLTGIAFFYGWTVSTMQSKGGEGGRGR